MGSVVWRFVLEKIREVGFPGYFGFVASFLGTVVGLEALYAKYFQQSAGHEALAWSIMASTSLFCLGGLVITCAITHLKQEEELERVIAARNALEKSLLRKRRSSKRKRW